MGGKNALLFTTTLNQATNEELSALVPAHILPQFLGGKCPCRSFFLSHSLTHSLSLQSRTSNERRCSQSLPLARALSARDRNRKNKTESMRANEENERELELRETQTESERRERMR